MQFVKRENVELKLFKEEIALNSGLMTGLIKKSQ